MSPFRVWLLELVWLVELVLGPERREPETRDERRVT